ncbi:hypothetical protein [Neolewinella marina]|nr:hypothetical protein [Neolewinella marina]
MDIAEQAFAIVQQNPTVAAELFEKAYYIERSIADTIEAVEDNEPSRSIFYKSAASLALNAKLFREAEISACLGISGRGDDVELDELRDIFDQVNFERHLYLNGISLENNQFQLSFVGNEVGSGYIKSSELIDRLNIITDLARKEVEKKANKKFNSRGRPGNVVQMYPLYFSAGMTGSYKIIIQIGNSKNGDLLFGDKYAIENSIITSIIRKIDYINSNNLEALKEEYGKDDPYYDFFVESIKSFAPDGDRIKMIGFTTSINGDEVQTRLTRKRTEIGDVFEMEENLEFDLVEEGTIVSVIGVLDLSKSRKTTHIFEIMDEEGRSYKFEASEGELASIVRDNYKDLVKVTGRRKKGKREVYLFVDIQNIE